MLLIITSGTDMSISASSTANTCIGPAVVGSSLRLPSCSDFTAGKGIILNGIDTQSRIAGVSGEGFTLPKGLSRDQSAPFQECDQIGQFLTRHSLFQFVWHQREPGGGYFADVATKYRIGNAQ